MRPTAVLLNGPNTLDKIMVFFGFIPHVVHSVFSGVSEETCCLNIQIEFLSDWVKIKVKQSRYRPGVAQRVPGS
jgi:hypothetical protein